MSEPKEVPQVVFTKNETDFAEFIQHHHKLLNDPRFVTHLLPTAISHMEQELIAKIQRVASYAKLWKKTAKRWRFDTYEAGELYQSLGDEWDEERKEHEVTKDRAAVWKKLAKTLRADLIAANNEIDKIEQDYFRDYP